MTLAVDVITAATINRPRDEVAKFAADPDNAPKWYSNIKSVRWRNARPLRVGSLIEFTAEFLGRTMEYTYEIKSFVPGELLVMATSEGPFPMETTYEWRSEGDDRTVMTLRNRGKPTGFGALLAPVMSLAVKSATRKDLRRLKTLLEGGNERTL